MYNDFKAIVECPHCKRKDLSVFQAYIGYLCLEVYMLGDNLPKTKPREFRGQIGPSLEALNGERSFWAYGLGDCEHCKEDMWVKIFIDRLVYSRVEIVDPPDNSYNWEFTS